jgi:hypothetical protein
MMGNESDYETEECRFEFCQDRKNFVMVTWEPKKRQQKEFGFLLPTYTLSETAVTK